MNIVDTGIEGLKILEPRVFNDERGYFFESYSERALASIGKFNWVQDNESKSSRGVLRGLHYQTGAHAQTKLVRAVIGEIYDVAVDIRPESETYGKACSVLLSGENKKQMLIPRGFAHGFLVLSDEAIFAYKCDNLYNKESEGGILYNDPQLDIEWPEAGVDYILSAKDVVNPVLGKHKPVQV